MLLCLLTTSVFVTYLECRDVIAQLQEGIHLERLHNFLQIKNAIKVKRRMFRLKEIDSFCKVFCKK